MKKSISLFLALVLCLSLAACGGKNATPANDKQAGAPQAENKTEASEAPTDEPEAAGPRTVTDTVGRTFEVPETVERVVVLSASECENVYALGAGGLVVGRGEYCNYPEEALAVPSVQSGYETNLEEIIALAPQVVFMSDMNQDPVQIAALEEAGIAVCVSKNASIQDAYANIRLIGTILGREDTAETLVTDMETRFQAIRDKVADQTPGTVYFEVSPLQYGLWTSGADTFMDEIAEMLNLENTFADITGWGEVSEEQVIQRNPDFIVTNAMYFGEGVLPADEIMGRPGWEDISAIQNGKVFHDSYDELSRPTRRLADAAEALYVFVYGE